MTESAIQSLKKLATETLYTLSVHDEKISLHDEHTRISINFEFSESRPNTAFVYLYVRTTSWDLDGERTDANDFISTMLAVFLRLEAGVSASLWDIPHPAVPAAEVEIYARYVIADQPYGSEYRMDKQGLSSIERLLHAVRQFEFIMPAFLDWTEAKVDQCPGVSTDYGWEDLRDWARHLASLIEDSLGTKDLVEFDDPSSEAIQYNWRRKPNWKYFRNCHSGVSLYEITGFGSFIVSCLKEEVSWKVLDGVGCLIYSGAHTSNVVPDQDRQSAIKILSQLEGSGKDAEIACVPLEHAVIFATNTHLLFLRSNSGRKRFEIERERVRKRHEQEAKILFPVAIFQWKEKIDDANFELLILELLKREPGVVRARLVSASNDPDGGRDILCEWITPPLFGSAVVDNVSPSKIRNVVVQCKAYRKAVNKSDVRDIRDTVEHHGADGYFLAVASHLTSPLTTHLDQMRRQGKVWVDWWTRSEIEERLQMDKGIASKFSGVVDCQ
jgi:hypothetical protein